MKRILSLVTSAALASALATPLAAVPDLQIRAVQYDRTAYEPGDIVYFTVVIYNAGGANQSDAVLLSSAFDVEISVGQGANETSERYRLQERLPAWFTGGTPPLPLLPFDEDGYVVFEDGSPYAYGDVNGNSAYDAGTDLRLLFNGSNSLVYENGDALTSHPLLGPGNQAVGTYTLPLEQGGGTVAAMMVSALTDNEDALIAGNEELACLFPFRVPEDWDAGQYPVTVYVDPPDLGNIWEGDGEGNNTYSGLPVRVNYNPVTPPTVDLQIVPAASAPGNVYLAEQQNITAIANDADGRVVSVEFFLNGIRVGQPDRIAPYSTSWVPGVLGEHTIDAVATDNDGLKGFTRVTVDVEAPPSGGGEGTPPRVEIVAPRDGGGFLPGTVLTMQALAADEAVIDGTIVPDGIVESVQYYVNGVPFGSAVGQPYRSSFTVPSNGTYVITAVATDDDGEMTTSAPVTIKGGVNPSDVPIVRITAPLPQGGGDTVNDVSVGSDMFINADVLNMDPSEIVAVRFFINGVDLQTSGAPLMGGHDHLAQTWAAYYRAASAGNYIISAEAETADGKIGQAEPIVLDVLPLEAPVPTNTLVTFPGTVQAGQWVQMTSTTNSGLLNVTRTDFFVNGVLIGSSDPTGDTGIQSFDYVWYPDTPGIYYLHTRAVQVDAGGGTADNWVISNRQVVTVIDPQASGNLQVELLEPADNAQVRVGEPIVLVADAEMPLGSVNRVQFFLNGNALPIDGVDGATYDDTYPYQAVFTPKSIGSYTFAAKGFSDQGTNAWSSNTVTVTANRSDQPTVALVRPAVDDVVTAGSDTLVVATASDLDGVIEQVEFRVNGVLVGTDNSEPFTTFWRPAAAGNFSFEVTAIDNVGLRTKTTREVVVSPLTGAPPSITLGLTANGNVTPGSRIVANANVIDADGDLSDVQVAFFLNGEQVDSDPLTPGVQSDTVAPFSTVLEPRLSEGLTRRQYSLRAVATDADGNSRAVDMNDLYISDFTVSLPSMVIRSPAPSSQLTEGSRASLRADVSGSSRNDVERVVFYANGIEVGEDKTAPYTLDWVPDQLGDVEITAAALLPAAVFAYDTTTTPHLTTFVRPVQVAAPVTVTVNPVTGVMPSVALNALPSLVDGGTPLAQGSEVILFANVVDNDPDPANTIASVSFFLDGQLLSEVSEPPFLTYWIPNREGVFYLNATVRDTNGNAVNSSYVNATVSDRVSPTPTITLSGPAMGQSGSPVTIRATLQGFVQNPERVVFYANGQEIGEVTTAPFNFTWEPRTEGDVFIFATAERELTGGGRVTAASGVHHLMLTPDAVPVIDEFSSSAEGGVAFKNDPVTFTVRSSDNGFINSVQFYRNGLLIDPAEGETAQSGSNVTFTDTPPATGSYIYYAVVTDNTGNPTITPDLTINVVAGTPPTVAITSPLAGSSVDINTPVTLRALASPVNPGGQIVEVRFFRNNILIGAPDTEAPYEVDFTPSTAGNYTLTATARDSSDNTTASAPVVFTVVADQPPLITQFSHDAPATPLVNTPITFTVGATDDRLLEKLELLVNGQAQNSTGIPTTLTYTPTVPGTYNFQLKATDTSGQSTVSAVTTIVVVRGASPNVHLVRPAFNLEATPGSTIELEASASDPDGRIVEVTFKVNNAQIGEALLTAPYRAAYTPSAPGTYLFSATARDNNDNVTASAMRMVTITEDPLPAISLQVLPDVEGQPVAIGSRTLLYADVIDTDETDAITVSVVQFYADGQLLGEATAEPYAISWKPVAAGTAYLNAVVLDSADQRVTSAYVPVLVGNTVSATPSIALNVPASGQSGSPLVLRATVQGFVQNPEAVVFHAGGEIIGSVDAPPYNLEWEPRASGELYIYATAVRELSGGNFVTAVSSISTLDLGADAPPVIDSFTSSVGTTAYKNGTITLMVESSDNGFIKTVELYRNGVLIDPATDETAQSGSSVTFRDVPPAIGRYTYRAVVTDNAGNPAISDELVIDVMAGTAPSIEITQPVGGSTVDLNEPITIKATAEALNPGGEIVEVRFYRNNLQIGSADNEAPYTVDYTPVVSGTFTLTAVARDSSDNETESEAVTVTALADNAPVFTQFTHDAPAEPLVNVPITFTVRATDDRLLQKVELLVNGQAQASEGIPATLSYTPTTPGSYTFRARATDSSGQTAISQPVVLAVTRGTPPTVAIIAPAGGTQVFAGDAVTVQASVQSINPGSQIVDVRFYRNNVQFGATDTEAPYEAAFTPGSAGTYSLTVTARDTAGNVATSAPVTLVAVADAPPVVDTPSHDAPASPLVNVPINFVVSARDDRLVQSVALVVNGQEQPAPGGVPATLSYTPTAPGTYRVQVKATDSTGQSTLSAVVTLVVVRGQSPLVSIAKPTQDVTLAQNKSITLVANASDADGSVVEVVFKANNVQIGTTLTTAPYQLVHTTGSAGDYAITATARDNSGNVTTSSIRTIHVVNGTLPEIEAFTNDTIGNESIVDVPIRFTVTATDEKGITQVQLFQDGLLVGTRTAAPYTFTAQPTSADAYAYHAVARNVDGNSAQSEVVLIDVREPDALNSDRDFVYQTFLDLHMRAPTAEEEDEYITALESGSSRAAVANDILGRARIGEEHQPTNGVLDDPVRQALVARFILGPQTEAATWPDRATLEGDVRLIRGTGTDALVAQQLLPAWLQAYEAAGNPVPPRALPPEYDPARGYKDSTERRSLDRMFRSLWIDKFGYKQETDASKDIMSLPYPTRSQLDDAIGVYAETFYPVETLFTQVVENYGTYTALLPGTTPIYYVYDQQNDRVVDLADTASLYVNLLRVQPTQAEVLALQQELPIHRIEIILGDPRYAARFPSATVHGAVTAKHWRYADWFGHYSDVYAPWIYHVELDWVYLPDNQPETAFWMWDQELGWVYSGHGVYPFMFQQNTSAWVYYYPTSGLDGVQWFYRYPPKQGTAQTGYFTVVR